MKLKLLLLFLYLFAFSLKSKAQLTADFPDSNYRWNFYYTISMHESVPGSWVNGSFYDNGDTLINNKHYRKVYFKYTYFGSGNYPGPTGYMHGDVIYCLLRNDKPLKRCYIIRQNFSCNLFSTQQDSNEKLLYDFNLKVGDLYPSTIYNGASKSDTYIDRIDTIIDSDGIKRAVYSINNPIFGNGNNLIEGVGGISGLHFGIMYIGDNYKSAKLRCFKNNNVEFGINHELFGGLSIYKTNCGQHIFTSISSEYIKSLIISPNPVSSTFSIEITEEEATFTIFNTLGQSQQIQGVREGAVWTLNASKLENGVYFLRANTKDKSYFCKFIKI